MMSKLIAFIYKSWRLSIHKRDKRIVCLVIEPEGTEVPLITDKGIGILFVE